MPEYVAPTISDTGDTFPVTFPLELAGTVVFVDFEVQEYTPPDSTDVNFDVGGSFEEAGVEVAFDTTVTEGIGPGEEASINVGFAPEISETMAGGDAQENLTVAEFGDTFPGTFPFELGPDRNLGLVLDVSLEEIADIEKIYGETLGIAEQQEITYANAERSVVTLGRANRQDIERGDAEIN